uniref:Uncharacterized protein n=1 Tax=Aegilops tauschii subsp. strangulata TaxID=200361 RepID=A0A453K7T6_AEGTS
MPPSMYKSPCYTLYLFHLQFFFRVLFFVTGSLLLPRCKKVPKSSVHTILNVHIVDNICAVLNFWKQASVQEKWASQFIHMQTPVTKRISNPIR